MTVGNFLLPQPTCLSGTLGQIYYEVMLNCWQQDLKQQKAPQEIMKDMNQVLYRVFNSKHINIKPSGISEGYKLMIITY